MNQHEIARLGGWVAVVAGTIGAAGALALVAVPPAVPAELFNYPMTSTWFVIVQVVFVLHHAGMAAAVWCYGRAGLAGTGRFAAVTTSVAVGVLAVFAAWELVALRGNGLVMGEETAWLDAGYGVLSILSAASMVLLGVATLRAHVLRGWARWTVLLVGVWLFAAMPILFLSFTVGRLVIAVWLLLFAGVGAGMLRWSAAQRGAVEDVRPGAGIGR